MRRRPRGAARARARARCRAAAADRPPVAEPGDARVAPEPHALPAGERARAPHDEVGGAFERGHVAAQVARAPRGSRWPGPRCATARRVGSASARTSSTRPASHIAATRLGDPLRVHVARHPDADHPHRNHRRAELIDSGTERRERATGEMDHLERAHDPTPIAAARSATPRADRALSSSRNASAQALDLLGRGLELGAAFEILAGDLQIVDRPSGRRGRCRRRTAPGGRAPRWPRSASRAPSWVRATDQSSPGSATSTRWCDDRGPLGGRRLGRADVHAPVHLHRVERHDLDVAELAREGERQRRLARRRRSRSIARWVVPAMALTPPSRGCGGGRRDRVGGRSRCGPASSAAPRR